MHMKSLSINSVRLVFFSNSKYAKSAAQNVCGNDIKSLFFSVTFKKNLKLHNH